MLQRAEAAARAGQRGEARSLYRQVLTLDSENEDAWLWLGYLAPTPRQSLDYLQRALYYHPRSARARQAVAWAQQRLVRLEGPDALRTAAPAPAPRKPGRPTPPSKTAARPQPSPEPAAPTPPRPSLHPSARAEGVVLPAHPPQAGGSRGSRAADAKRPAPPKSERLGVEAKAHRRPPALFYVSMAILIIALLATLGYSIWLRLGSPPLLPPPPTAGPTPTATITSDMEILRQWAGDATSKQDWERAIQVLEQMREYAPDDDGLRQQLAVAHLRYGLQLVQVDRIEDAIIHYDAAIRFYANDMDLQTARRLAVGYRDGRLAYQEQRWGDAADLLAPVFKLAPDFRDTADMLYTSYMQQGQALETAPKLSAARDAYAEAVKVRPQDEEAHTKLARITAILTPPTPTPTPRPKKRIVISIAKQHFWGYENERVIFDWKCSTGLPDRPTRPGQYEVLDKIPEAWSSVWGLRMPFWLGIYWAGGSENGIHALPINRQGQTLWAGLLGRPASFGCIILDTKNAERLYYWADIGTPVTIQP
ncbi:MAG: L,D-transpeptidase family protein [Anaerolineae bacterium]